MPIGILKAAGLTGTILVILALIISLLKQVIGFIGFLTMMIKILVVLAFVALLVGIGLMILRGRSTRREPKD